MFIMVEVLLLPILTMTGFKIFILHPINSLINYILIKAILNLRILPRKQGLLIWRVGDFNNDGWLDIFVANDFITPDKLYINNQDGTFVNQSHIRFKHT